MLEQVFGSKTRVKMMQVFLDNPDRCFFVRELTRETDCLINSVRRELDNLLDIGFIVIEDKQTVEVIEQDDSSGSKISSQKGLNSKKFFRLNKNNLFRSEFGALFSKGKLMIEKKFTDKLKATGEIRYICLSGFFIENPNSSTDILIIGKLDKEKIQRVIKVFEKEIGHEINYTLMDVKEYKLRRDIGDRFLKDIIEDEKNLVIIDDLKIIEEL